MEKHFVTFYSPGTFVSETTEKPIDAWDSDAAVAMARKISERYGARPYGFRFTTRARADDELDSRVVKTSPMHYLGGRVRTLEDVRRDADPNERILLSNMEVNEIARVITNDNSWRWTGALADDDIVLDVVL